MARLDPHSYRDDEQPSIREIHWDASIDFNEKRIRARVKLFLDRPGQGTLDLDTRELRIQEVRDGDGAPLHHTLHPAEPILGSRLSIELWPNTRSVEIVYETAKNASALGWLEPPMTSGGSLPFLYSQCQAIHARSLLPLQDTPAIRFTYEAQLQFPRQLKGLMAAAFLSREEEGELAKEHYRMPQPIPSYLVAFAVGQLSSKELGPRSRIWAEPALLEAAANEFADVERMIESAERLFGPYGWDRFDILTLPRSFPYGGMENPRLTFLTPTLLAGDKSLVNVLAHELAHSWTGNLVTNCSAEHFWLNEGFTVYAERRILEALEGRDTSALHAALGRRSLDSAIGHFRDRPELTRLVPHLASVDPDEAFSQIPYEKGYLFLKLIEETVGKERFDAYLQGYVNTFRFRSICTDDFKKFTESHLPGVLDAVRADEWLYGPGVPDNAPASQSEKLKALQTLAGHLPRPSVAKGWSSVEWQLFLESLPHPSPEALLAELDSHFHLTENKNYEVLVSWLVLAAQSSYEEAFGRIEEVLSEVGRLKYLKPLYMALAQRPSSKSFAQRCYSQYSARYHPIARQVLEPLL